MNKLNVEIYIAWNSKKYNKELLRNILKSIILEPTDVKYSVENGQMYLLLELPVNFYMCISNVLLSMLSCYHEKGIINYYNISVHSKYDNIMDNIETENIEDVGRILE